MQEGKRAPGEEEILRMQHGTSPGAKYLPTNEGGLLYVSSTMLIIAVAGAVAVVNFDSFVLALFLRAAE